jgi:hypothetical protein
MEFCPILLYRLYNPCSAGYKNSMKAEIDRPKLLGKPEAREARLHQIREPHVAPLTRFVENLRRVFPGRDIPYFDPWDGGIRAEVLFLQEAPGPKAVISGFVSRNNPDETAKNIFEISIEAGLDRKRTVRWNVVPWYIGTGTKIRAARTSDVRDGVGPLFELLPLLLDLRGVVLMGRKAELIASELSARRLDLRVFKSPHASPLYCNRAPGNRDRILCVFREVAAFLGPG